MMGVSNRYRTDFKSPATSWANNKKSALKRSIATCLLRLEAARGIMDEDRWCTSMHGALRPHEEDMQLSTEAANCELEYIATECIGQSLQYFHATEEHVQAVVHDVMKIFLEDDYPGSIPLWCQLEAARTAANKDRE